jgi:hypothetical protein
MLSWFRSDFVSVSNVGLFFINATDRIFVSIFFVPDLCYKVNSEVSPLINL